MDAAKRVTRLLRLGHAARPAEPPAPDDRPLLHTPYELGGRDGPLPLGVHQGRLYQQGAHVAEGEFLLSFIWLPYPNVRFEMVAPDSLVVEPGEATLELDLADPVRVPVFVGRVVVGATPEVVGTLTERVSCGDAATIDAISFLLANTPEMHGEWITKPGAGGWLGRVQFESTPWRGTLEVRRDNRELTSELKAFGGYAVTHVGRLERTDGLAFTVARGREILDGLNLFLSFARGFWTPPLLPVGYNGDGIVWREWLGRTSSPWRSNFAWFSPSHPGALADAFPRFMQRWQDPKWRDSSTLGIWWYIEGNGTTTAETSLLLAQVALELFSWVILVQERGQLSRTAHKKARAEDNIRSLLQWAEVPLAVPPELAALSQHAASEGWADGPAALIGLRNKLTHPGGEASAIFAAPTKARVELQQLALWYVELILLRFHGYRGDYVNRHKAEYVGEVERVPWE